MDLTRRKLLSATCGVGTGLLAGCVGDDGSTSSQGPTAVASFFVFGDITSQVAGDTANDELLVPVGQHGHGWEPGVRVRESIRSADVLVHGMDGFQPWVDAISSDLDDDAGVETVDVSAELDLLVAGEDGDHDGHDEDNQQEGNHSGHDGEDHDHGSRDGEDHGDEGDHGDEMDPHFWMDPTRLRNAVDAVQQAFANVDAENAEQYAENAEVFRRELADLDERIGSVVEAGDRNVILVAGHNSHRYLGDRYGLRVEALTDVSPDDSPTLGDIERAQEVIQANDLQYICTDPLESQRAAEQLVAETSVEAVLPLTAMPGLTDEWDENGWGYVDVMENVNIPTLEATLGAQ